MSNDRTKVVNATTNLIRMCGAVGQAIQEFGPRGVPSGHLYAALMPVMSLDTYNRIIQLLKDNDLVKESHHLLTYCGPVIEKPKCPNCGEYSRCIPTCV